MADHVLESKIDRLIELVKKHQKTSDRLEQTLDQDREDITELKNRVGHLEQESNALREIINKLPKQTQNQVAEVVEPMREEAQNLKEEISKKKVMIIQGRGFWIKLGNWWMRGWE